MRTTLTIDEHIIAALKEKAHKSGKSFKAVVNETLAEGLKTPPPPRRRKFKLTTRALGIPNVDLTKATQLAGVLEDEAILNKLEQRK